MSGEAQRGRTKRRLWILAAIVLASVFLCVIGTLGTRDGEETALVTVAPTKPVEAEAEVPTEVEPATETASPTMIREPSHIPEATDTSQPKATAEPTATKRRPPTQTPTAEPRVMYFCEIDRCKASGGYGLFVEPQGISVWQNHAPDRGRVLRKAGHHEEARIIRELRTRDAPGGLWYELENGGWTNDFWLTDEPCTLDNLEQHTIPDC